MAWKILSVSLGLVAFVVAYVWFLAFCIMIFGVFTPEGNIGQLFDGLCWTVACGVIGIPITSLSISAWERGT